MKMGRILAVVIVTVMALSTAVIYAEDMGDTTQDMTKREAHYKKMTEDLKLTPQQKTALDKDREEFAAKSKDLKEKIRAARASLKEELDKPKADVARVNSLTADIKNMVGQQIQNRVDKVMTMKQILTPEQFSKMKDSMKHRKHGNYNKHGKIWR